MFYRVVARRIKTERIVSKNYQHNVIAIVYDFDGTLTPQPMQEYTILPEIGIKNGKDFWKEVNAQAEKSNGEPIAAYMRLMLEKARAENFPITPDRLKELAANIEYFDGVKNFFTRINKYVAKQLGGKIEVRHYIISAGLKEIISGTTIAEYFYKVFASEYHYNEYDAATFPNIIVNDTLKTQFIFRINKGKEKLSENINLHMPMSQRPIPFQNILYIGDGLTDVPCMTVIKKNGGFAIAVFKGGNRRGKKICRELLRAERVDFIAQADYRRGSELDRLIKLLLNNMVEGIKYAKESFEQSKKYRTERNQ